MTDKPNEKTEIKVILEPQDSASKYILVALILVLSGLLFAILAGEQKIFFHQMTKLLEIVEMVWIMTMVKGR